MAFFIILSLLFFSVDLLSKNIEQIINNVPEYREKVKLLITEIGENTGVENITERIQERLLAIDFQAFLTEILKALTSFIGHFVIILIYVAFLLIESTVFNKKMEIIFNAPQRFAEIRDLVSKMGSSVNAYLSVKSLVSLLTGLLSYIVLLLFEVDYPAMWAFIIFLMNFIPYIGSLIATLLPAVFAMFQFNSFIYFVWVFLGVEAIQVLVANYIEPKVMGRRLNLSPLIVILSLSFWGMIWGVLGMFLAVPLTSIVLIILSHFPSTHSVALLFSEKGEIHKPAEVVIESEPTQDQSTNPDPSGAV
jgi:predicted PurR-regulated permease PerM